MSKRWLVVAFLVAGCGGSSEPPPNGVVTVAVTRAGVPIAGATVVFDDPDGAVTGRGTTDADGVATAELVGGGMVTVVDPAVPTRLMTLTEVSPGPGRLEVPLDTSITPPAGPEAGTLTIPAPPGAPPAGTDHVMIETGCGSFSAPSLPATVSITADCITAVRAVPVIVTAWEPPGDLEHPGNSLAAFSGLALAGNGSNAFALATPAWSTDCAQIDITTDPVMSVQLRPRLGGMLFDSTPGFCQVTQPPTGYAYAVYDLGEGFTASGFAYPAGQALRGEMFRTEYAALPATIAIAESTDLLLGDVELTGVDGNGASWGTDPALADADVIYATLSWGLSQDTYVNWQFIVPGDATAVARPELPADVESWAPLAGAVDHVVELRYLDAPWLDGLDAIEHSLAPLLDPAPRVSYQPAGTSLRTYRELFYPDAP